MSKKVIEICLMIIFISPWFPIPESIKPASDIDVDEYERQEEIQYPNQKRDPQELRDKMEKRDIKIKEDFNWDRCKDSHGNYVICLDV